jgi:uncharacterized membrane-anchored protein YitT (DUF2179 family)
MNKKLREFLLITISTMIIVIGIYFFRFPNNFSFGGVTGIAVVLGKLFPLSPSFITFVLNMILLVIGFIFLGKRFGIKTVYASVLLSLGLWALEYIYPMSAPLTDEPMLELTFAIALPAFGSAVLFNLGASGGGTDIIAMIMRKYTSFNIGSALFYTDLLITLAACMVFDIKTGLFSLLGLMIKSLVIDGVIESINLSKYFNIVCDDAEPICDFIVNKLKRSATVCDAKGAFSHKHKNVIFTALNRRQAVQLRQYIKKVEPSAFILISNTSEIVGKGFQE